MALRKRVMVNFLSTKVDREALIAFQLFKKKTQTQSLSKEKKAAYLFFLLSYFVREADALSLFRGASSYLLRDKVYDIIITNISYKWSQQDIADRLFMSRATLKRKLLSEKTTFSDIYLNARMNQAIKLLRIGEYNISQVANMCGYESISYFARVFKSFFNRKPSEYIL